METYENKYFFEIERPQHNLHFRQYIYYFGRYRYNWHKALEILLVLKGPIEMNCDGENFQMEEGDFLLIDSNVGHASLAKEERGIGMVLQLEPEYLEEYFGSLRNWKFGGHTTAENRSCSSAIEIRSLLSALIRNLESQSPMEKILLEQELNRLLYLVFQMFPPEEQSEEEMGRSDKSMNFIEKLLPYIEENYREKLTLEDISHYCRYNPSYMSTYFRKNVGIGFYDYLTRIRVREATLELCSTDNHIVDIAASHGFADVKSFNLAFRKTFGKSPREYRKQILDENRGKELTEKRTFLSLEDPYVSEKLDRYIEELSNLRGGKNGIDGNLMRQESYVRSLQEQTRNMYEAANSLRMQMEEVCRQIENISGTDHEQAGKI